jgi:adenosine deaminase/adenosine deaminase CECR1
MKKIASLTLVACIAAVGANICYVNSAMAKEVQSDTQKKNYLATKRYYDSLINGTPQLAELNLLTTLLPKGGDIHHHYTGALYAETYLDWVEKQKFCVYDNDDAEHGHEKFRINTSTNASGEKDCLTAAQIRKDDGFYRELLTHWSDKDFSNHDHEQSPPDKQFFDTFGYFSPATGYPASVGLAILKQQAKADNLQYIETMLKGAPSVDNPEFSTRINQLAPDADGVEVNAALAAYADFLDHDATAQQKVTDYKAALVNYAAGIDDADFTLRFQSYVSRNSPPAQVFAGLYSAFAAAHDNKLIVGVNIVGPENGIVAMHDYHLHMLMFNLLKKRFPDVHLSMHAGELTLGMVPPDGLRNHIHEAVEIAGAERIGHGIDVTYEADPDRLLAEMIQHNVAVEVCLSSNAFILGVEGQAHPVTVLMRHHVPFVIATDDAGVSRSSINAEYELFISCYKPSYDFLKEVIHRSIRYSFLTEDEKALQLKQLDRRFAQFEATVAKMSANEVRNSR